MFTNMLIVICFLVCIGKNKIYICVYRYIFHVFLNSKFISKILKKSVLVIINVHFEWFFTGEIDYFGFNGSYLISNYINYIIVI